MNDIQAMAAAHKQMDKREDEYQRRVLKLPNGEISLADGRILRPILGYYEHLIKLPMINESTRRGLIAAKGWKHLSTGFVVSATIDNTLRWGPLLHVSMSYIDHNPTWEEIKLIKDVFFPHDMDAVMILPREEDFINVHEHCFHLWQAPQKWGLQ